MLEPLRTIPASPALKRALAALPGRARQAQKAWTSAYDDSAGQGARSTPRHDHRPGRQLRPGPDDDGRRCSRFAQSGGLDGALLTSKQFYQTDYTKPLLFMADGGVLAERAEGQHLLGDQWGMMNETGSYPGQVWLWLYTFWYQIKPFSTSANADVLVMVLMGVLSLAFVCIPFIPGVRDLPRQIPIYKLIWREHYRTDGVPNTKRTPREMESPARRRSDEGARRANSLALSPGAPPVGRRVPTDVVPGVARMAGGAQARTLQV